MERKYGDYTDDELKVVWFGPDDAGEMTEERQSIRIPVLDKDVFCTSCRQILKAGDPGIRMPSFVFSGHHDGFAYWHAGCYKNKVLWGI